MRHLLENHKKINLFNFGWKMPSLSEWKILLNFWLSKKLKRSKKTIINQGDVFFRQNIISQEFAPALLTTINTKLFCHEKMFLVNDITFFLRFDLSLMNIKSISCFSQLMITINLL